MSTALLDRVGAASGAFSGITRLYELKLEAAARRMRARCWWKRSPATSNCRRLVNGKAVCGFFRDAGKIKDGDIVKLLVTQRKDVLYVHSLLCIGDSLFFDAIECLLRRACFVLELHEICKGPDPGYLDHPCSDAFIIHRCIFGKDENLISISGIIFVMPLIFCFSFAYWSFGAMRGSSIYATEIFAAHGFPGPGDFDMRKGATLFKGHSYGFIGCGRELALRNMV